MATWYWSADTLFWQVSIVALMSNINEVHSKPRLYVSANLFWSMAAELGDSVVVVVVVVVVRTRPPAIPLAMITMRKSTHGFPFLSHDKYGGSAWRPFGPPELRYNQKDQWALINISQTKLREKQEIWIFLNCLAHYLWKPAKSAIHQLPIFYASWWDEIFVTAVYLSIN